MNKRLMMLLSVVIALLIGAVATITNAEEQVDFSDHRVIIAYAEYITDPDSGQAGGVEVLQADLGNAQLPHDFVYNDPRAALWDAVPGVSFGVKYGNTSADANLSNQGFWMSESLRVWENTGCSNLQLTEIPVSGAPGLVQNFFNGGGINIGLVEADLTQVGFLSPAEFPYFAANPNVLGVAFTLTWVDGNGNATDIDGNGKVDVALREIYYNDAFEWADNGLEGRQPDGIRYFDFPTVAIHEAGHGLSAAHFGTIALHKDELKASPRSIMNAIYGGTLRDLTGRDIGSHCSNWAQWPNH